MGGTLANTKPQQIGMESKTYFFTETIYSIYFTGIIYQTFLIFSLLPIGASNFLPNRQKPNIFSRDFFGKF